MKKNSRYRHARHAGNRADVWKHVMLSSVVFRICARERKRFHYFETHCGGPGYRLPYRGGEWRDGIARALPGKDDRALIGLCYFDQFGGDLGPGAGRIHAGSFYWSSWMQVAHLLGSWGLSLRLKLCDTSPEVAAQVLPMGIDFHHGDGFEELERDSKKYSLVFIDPPYGGDDSDDFRKVAATVTDLWLKKAHFLVWYPLYSAATRRRIQKILNDTYSRSAELIWDELPKQGDGTMRGCGMLCGEVTHRMLDLDSGNAWRVLAEKLGGRYARRLRPGANLFLVPS